MRKPRQLKNGALYHVTARTNRKEMILDEGGMKELFLQVLTRAGKRYKFRIENFCLMGNHFHLLIRPSTGESLSRILQWILSVFAMVYNRIHGYTGHVWGSRFFSRIMENFREFLFVFAYIDNNPLKANQTHDPRDWRYGGLWHNRHGLKETCSLTEYAALVFPEHTALLLEGW